MLTIFTDNTMISGTINDRLDTNVVAKSTIMVRLERLAEHLLRAVVPVLAVCAYPISAVRHAKSCDALSLARHWQPAWSSSKQLAGTGHPVGPGRFLVG